MRKLFVINGFVALALLASSCGPGPIPTPTASPATVLPTPSATPAMITPAPTFTGTPTPTPIVHIIQKGETLLELARRYGVSVEAIQEANSILDPRRLQVGQEIFIPQDEEALLKPPTPTPTAVPYAIENLGLYQSPSGGLWVLGEVHNITTVAVEQVQVAINLQNEDGETVASARTSPSLDIIFSGGRAPFAVYFGAPVPAFTQYQVVALSAVPVSRWERIYRDLAIYEEKVDREDSSLYIVQGEVWNVGQNEACAITLAVTAYDVEGRVTGVRAIDLPLSSLKPNEGAPFQLNIIPAGREVVTHTVQVQGRRMK